MIILCCFIICHRQINSQLYTASERAELHKAIEAMLSYGLTYKQERLAEPQQQQQPHSLSPGKAGRKGRSFTGGAEGGKPKNSSHKGADDVNEEHNDEADDEAKSSRDNKASQLRNLYTYVLEPYDAVANSIIAC